MTSVSKKITRYTYFGAYAYLRIFQHSLFCGYSFLIKYPLFYFNFRPDYNFRPEFENSHHLVSQSTYMSLHEITCAEVKRIILQVDNGQRFLILLSTFQTGMRHFIFVREEVHRFLITFCIIYMQMVLYELVGVSGSALSTIRSRSVAEV